MLIVYTTQLVDDREKWWPEYPNSNQWLYARHIAASLNEQGIRYVFMPLGMLSRTGNEMEIRRRFIEENLIDTVIEFPGGTFMKSNAFIALDEDIILHETELMSAKKESYKLMRRGEKRTLFWQEMGRLFDENDITVFTAVINPSEFKQIYNSKYLHDEYFVCLEIIMENFAHFLEKENAVGTIYLESQNPKADNKLSNHYYQLIRRGTRHINNHALREKIIGINFYQKADKNIGLQIADFIPNTLKKYANGISNKQPSIETNIVKCLYDGKIGKFVSMTIVISFIRIDF